MWRSIVPERRRYKTRKKELDSKSGELSENSEISLLYFSHLALLIAAQPQILFMKYI